MSSRISAETFGRPSRRRDFQVQYSLNPSRCHRTTVSGCTMHSTSFHRDHILESKTQNNRSDHVNVGLLPESRKVASCWRKARFSAANVERD